MNHKILCTVWSLSLVIGLGAAPSKLAGQTQGTVTPRDHTIKSLYSQARRLSEVSAVRQRMLATFDAADQDGGGISAADATLKAQIDLATQRAKSLQGFLQNDLDADGAVSLEELERALTVRSRRPLRTEVGTITPSAEQSAEILRQLADPIARYDLDGDGTITIAEATASIQATLTEDPRRQRRQNVLVDPIYDTNADGTISRQEYLDQIDPVLAEFDVNMDGTYSKSESELIGAAYSESNRRLRNSDRQQQQRQQAQDQIEACGLGGLASNARIGFIATYEGRAMSTVSIAGPGRVTTVADVKVAVGQGPLVYGISSHGPIVFRFTGATDRIAAVVDFTGRNGFQGIDRSKIRWVTDKNCTSTAWRFNSRTGASKPMSALEAAVGRKVRDRIEHYDIGALSLPSGKNGEGHAYPDARRLKLEGPAGAVWRGFLRFNPGGLVEIDPAEVAAPQPATRYDVLPQEAGLAMLVESGRILPEYSPEVLDEITPQADGTIKLEGMTIDGGGGDDLIRSNGLNYTLDPDGIWRARREPTFRILKKITIPAGLIGAHTVRFILPRDVEFPDGDPGRSKIERTR